MVPDQSFGDYNLTKDTMFLFAFFSNAGLSIAVRKQI